MSGRAFSFFVVTAIALAALVAARGTSAADPLAAAASYRLPWTCGTKLSFTNDYIDHGVEGFALDFAGAEGTHILAPATGTATYYTGTKGFANHVRMESIDPDNYWRIDLAHMSGSNLTPNVPTHVNMGDLIGYMGHTGDATGTHVHVEIWHLGASYLSTIDYILTGSLYGHPASYWTRTQGTPAPLIESNNCGTPPTPPPSATQGIPIALDGDRVASVQCDTGAYVKEGSLNAGWTLQAQSVKAVALAGNRIGILTDNGEFYVKEGSLIAGWMLQRTNTVAIALSGDRIGALESNGNFYVKEGSLVGGWTLQRSNTKGIALDGIRIGALENDGTFYVKEGSLIAGWAPQRSNTNAIALSGDRIGALENDGNFYVKEGSLIAGWSSQQDNTRAIALNGDRIGALTNDGNFWAKEGSLIASWSLQLDQDVQQIVISGSRMGAVRGNGDFLAKDDSLGTGWVLQMDHVRFPDVSYSECPPVPTVAPTTPSPATSPPTTPTATTPAATTPAATTLAEITPAATTPSTTTPAATTPAVTIPPTPNETVDANCDGQFDAHDGLALLRLLGELSVQSEGTCDPARDVNCDGRADGGDVLSVLRTIIAGPPYPTGCLAA